MSEYAIESLGFDDLSDCLQTIHRAFLPNCETYGFTKENYPDCAAFLAYEDLLEEKRNGTHIYAIRIDGVIAGCVMLKRTQQDVYSFRRFAVLPEYRHLGFGKQLVEHCRRKAKEYGGKKLRLLMIYQNAHLRALYESYGFTLKEIGHDAQHPFEYGIYEMEL
jgi:GNAT superfamily N-acetyltransferase